MKVNNSISRLGIVRLLNAALSFGAIAFFSLEMGAESIGLYFLFQAILGMTSLPADFGIGGALIKRISEVNGTADRTVLSSGFAMTAALICVVATVVLFSAPWLNQYFGEPFAVLLIPALVAKQFGNITRNILKAELKIPKAAYSILLQRVVFTTIGVASVLRGGGAVHLIYAMILSFFVQGIYSTLTFETSFGSPSLSAVKSLWEYAKFGSVAYVDSYLYNWVDVTLLGFFVGPSAVGIYEVAWRVSSFITLPLKAIEEVLMPATSNWNSTNQKELIESIFPKAILGGFYFVIPTLFGAIAIGGDLLAAVFGSEFRAGSLVLIVLLGGRLIEVFDGVSKTIISGLDRPELRARSVVISIILNVGLNAILIPQIGMVGAAIGTVVSFTASTALIMYYLSLHVPLRTRNRRLGWVIVSSLVMFIVVNILTANLNSSLQFEVALTVLAGGAVYILTTLTYTPIRKNVISVATSLGD